MCNFKLSKENTHKKVRVFHLKKKKKTKINDKSNLNVKATFQLSVAVAVCVLHMLWGPLHILHICIYFRGKAWFGVLFNHCK